MTLRQLGELTVGVNCAAVAQPVSRFGKRLEHQRELRQTLTSIENELSTVTV